VVYIRAFLISKTNANAGIRFRRGIENREPEDACVIPVAKLVVFFKNIQWS